MSHEYVASSARELQEVTTRIAWRQWRAIGGSAASNKPWRSAVDPEALILASLFLVDQEPRFEDILFSWVEANAGLLSVQRLRNLQKDYPKEIGSRVAEFAQRTRSFMKHPRWRSLGDDADDDTRYSSPTMERATRAPLKHPATLLLRLRTAMGVGIKADALAVILGHQHPLNVREIADALSYSQVGVRAAVEDLARAGFILSIGRKPAAFSAPHGEWHGLLHLQLPSRWLPWHHWFAFVIDYITLEDRANEKELGDYALDVRVRELVARHDLFFRYSANALGAAAFHTEMGSYPSVIDALLAWAQLQE